MIEKKKTGPVPEAEKDTPNQIAKIETTKDGPEVVTFTVSPEMSRAIDRLGQIAKETEIPEDTLIRFIRAKKAELLKESRFRDRYEVEINSCLVALPAKLNRYLEKHTRERGMIETGTLAGEIVNRFLSGNIEQAEGRATR